MCKNTKAASNSLHKGKACWSSTKLRRVDAKVFGLALYIFPNFCMIMSKVVDKAKKLNYK